MRNRLYPKLRTSWSVYYSWTRGDWTAIEDYYLGIQRENPAMFAGSMAHEYFSEAPLDIKVLGVMSDGSSREMPVEKEFKDFVISGIIDLCDAYSILDYKYNSYDAKQLNLYDWLLDGPPKKLYVAKYNNDLQINKIVKVRNIERNWLGESTVMAKDIKNYLSSRGLYFT